MDPSAQDQLFACLPDKPTRAELATVDEPITVEEVEAVIKASPRGTVCGPDGLGNDWYRDLSESLSPVLAPLFTKWYKDVFCIAKNSAPTSGLDFRPIALLNTDYKLYSRILLRRIRVHVPQLVADTQYGFVPGRQVHDAIDIWTALQTRASAGSLPAGAIAVMLDFEKAYDSLDRRFLTLALRRHRFSHSLAAAVEAMHLGTTAAYIADDQTSTTEAILNGIRQGCPLAPTLFILAIDVLYEVISADDRLPGLPLTPQISVSIAGLADDTATYLQSTAEADSLVAILDEFAAASGLRVNATKSVAVCFSTTSHVRYLGAQISTSPRLGAVWDIVLQQLRARLHLAAIKTTDLLQRVQVCRAVILPELLFVARHAWPTAPIVKRLQRFIRDYAWHGIISDLPNARRAWMSSAVAAARRVDGGLQLPAVHDELLNLSTRTLQRWLSPAAPVGAACGRILAAPATGGATRST